MKKYSIKNMKSFKEEAEVEIKPITIFVGKNSCGKSSLIRFPVVISQSIMSDADTPILFFDKNIDYGNYEDVVYGHNKTEKVEFSLNYEIEANRLFYRIKKESRFWELFSKELNADIRVRLMKYSKRLIVDSFMISLNGKRAIIISRLQREKYKVDIYDVTKDSHEVSLTTKMRFTGFMPIIDDKDFFEVLVDDYCNKNELDSVDGFSIRSFKKKNVRRIYESIYDDEIEFDNVSGDTKKIMEIVQLIRYYVGVLFCVRMSATQSASDTYYIGPFRENPSRVYRDVERQVDSVGARGEDVSAMLKNDYNHGKKILSRVSQWFKESMNCELSLKDIGGGLYNIVVKKDDGTEDNLIDVGYGISQVLPIVTQLMRIKMSAKRRYYSSAGFKSRSTFVIEQPELHLHPEAQAELANLFVNMASSNENEQSINVLIETHSEHLIRRLQALIADDSVKISNDQVKIYYVEKNQKNEAYIKEMHIQENGQFEEEWPTGFFDKAYTLSMELVRNNFKDRESIR